MEPNVQHWITFLNGLTSGFDTLQQAPDGNPLLRVQVGEQRVSIIQEPESNFSFWIERYEGADGSSGDELVVDAGTEAEQLRLAQNVVEAFLQRRGA